MQIRRALRPFQCISLKLCSWHRWAPVDEVSCWKTTSLPNRVGTTLKDVQRWKLQVGCHTIHSLAVGPGWWTVGPTSRDQAVLKNRGRLPSQAEAFFGLGWANGVCAVSACVACPLSMVLICANIIQLICQIYQILMSNMMLKMLKSFHCAVRGSLGCAMPGAVIWSSRHSLQGRGRATYSTVRPWLVINNIYHLVI